MKLLSVLAALLFLAGSTWAAESTHKLLFRDFGLTDATKVGALSFGAASWTDNDEAFKAGGYWDFKPFLLWGEKLNLGIGMVVAPPPKDSEHTPIDLRLETSVSTHLFNCVEVGGWYAPFWGLMKESDPYGVMVGYYLKF